MSRVNRPGGVSTVWRVKAGLYRLLYDKSCFPIIHISTIHKGIILQAEDRQFEIGWGGRIFSIYLILPATLGPGVYSTLTQMCTRSRKIFVLGSRARPERKADNPTAICEPIVSAMWDPQHLTTLQASTGCYRDSFTFYDEWYRMSTMKRPDLIVFLGSKEYRYGRY
jgi:hypothetical protein